MVRRSSAAQRRGGVDAEALAKGGQLHGEVEPIEPMLRVGTQGECFKPGQGGDVSATRPALRGWSGRPIDLVPTLASLVSRNLPPV